MPRSWLNPSAHDISFGSPGPPTIKDIFICAYGERWRERAALIFGRKKHTVEKWCTGTLVLPVPVMKALLQVCSDPNRRYRVRRKLEEALERELEFRVEGGKYAAKWLTLVLEGKAELRVPESRKRGRSGVKKTAKGVL